MTTGTLYGLGTGPGDPDLLTLKALKVLEACPVIAHFAKRGNQSNARRIVESRLAGKTELPLLYPVTTEADRHGEDYRRQIGEFYEASAASVAAHLDAGRSVAVLSEGDPLFYGSYMHIHVRLAHRYPAVVIPGITAMSGAWSAAGLPIAQGDDVMTVVPATLDDAALKMRLTASEAIVIMKLGRHLPRVRAVLSETGRLDEAIYVERATMAEQKLCRLADKKDDAAPYFSLILVPGWEIKP